VRLPHLNGYTVCYADLQENIRKLFRANDWTEEVMFDSYVDDYDW
jgi:hypothetical protein